MILSIASGKGGTGKTTVATNLALSLDQDIQFLDCDVDAPNAHIFLKPWIREARIVTVPEPIIDESRCTYCGKCAEVCAYNAIAVLEGKVILFPDLCHSCGGCALLCPERAIEEDQRKIGIIEIGDSRHVRFISGRLNIGEVASSSLIKAVKGWVDSDRTVIIDAPPGTSCPFVHSVMGSDYCVLVTEPTPFGLYDLKLAIKVVERLHVPFGVLINRYDVGDDRVEWYCEENNIPILMRIPFDTEISSLSSDGISIVEGKEGYAGMFQELHKKVLKAI
jgi:MinD superfamily P-loop ATPase